MPVDAGCQPARTNVQIRSDLPMPKISQLVIYKFDANYRGIVFDARGLGEALASEGLA